tara:strand:- start:191 stop:718 length:528 start_codon:yes stop_codon:yes gene_type:complete
MIEIIRDYLPEELFKKIMLSIDQLPWTIARKMNENSNSDNQFAFIQDYTSKLYTETYMKVVGEEFTKLVMNPYIKKHNLKKIKVLRCRTNMYIKTVNYQDECGYHQDQLNPNIKTLLIYMEDSDGCTQFKDTGQKIISERNKAIIFPASDFHQTISQTNTLYRHNININFFIPED